MMNTTVLDTVGHKISAKKNVYLKRPKPSQVMTKLEEEPPVNEKEPESNSSSGQNPPDHTNERRHECHKLSVE